MPPSSIRRPLTVTTWLLLSAAGLALSPLLLAAAAAASALTRERKPLIFARLLVAYFAYELTTLVGCGALWLGAGAGRYVRRPRFAELHWRLLRWYVGGFARAARTGLGLRAASEDSADAERALERDGPLLIFSRHAGPGDTVLLIDQLLSRFHRHPSVVFKEALALDPCIDLLAHRLPHAVLDTSDRSECEAQISAVTRRLDRRGALLLFPEGGNFIPQRRRAALDALRHKGHRRQATQAERMPHVLPPHPTGVRTALAGNPSADVIFAAHTGLGLAAYPRELWRRMPIGGTLRTRMWHVPAADVPGDAEAQTEWLYAWWKRIDDWLDSASAEGE